MERDFEIGPRKFKLNKIDTFKQFHIVRRLAPILGDLIPVIMKLKGSGINPDALTDDQMGMFAPIMAGIAKLSDADANLVLLGLCSSVEMQQMPIGNWARVATDAGLMFQDLTLPLLFQIAGRALQFNLSGFFELHQQASLGGK